MNNIINMDLITHNLPFSTQQGNYIPEESLPKMEFVDLGLPSGTKWARYNLGADDETDYGSYFQYGHVIGYKGDEAAANSYWSTSIYNGGYSDFNRDYFSNMVPIICDSHGIINPEYDAATKILGEQCKIPTISDFHELLNNTTYKKETINNVKCYKLTANNGNSIIFPFCGYYDNGLSYKNSYSGRVDFVGEQVALWLANGTNSVNTISADKIYLMNTQYRYGEAVYVSMPIRAIYK